jgi:signal transduction histidine kinase
MQDGDASIEAQLRASRARLVLNADAERRAIERLLHDGIQQELVAIAVKLQLVRRLPHSEQTAAQSLLDEIEQETRDALDGVRAVADEIYPSVLAARGLVEAVRGASVASEVAVRIEATELGRYPPELEGAVYFCCREALRVAAALGARPVLRLWEADHALHFEVAESEGSSDLAESDLTELGDRVEALGGRLTIGPGPEGRTRLNAAIPVATSRPRPDRG